MAMFNTIINNISPSKGTSFQSLGGIDYLMGSLLILIGILIFVLFHRKARQKMEEYKKEQLKVYNKNRKTNVQDYSKTSLYVPFWPKAKYSAPVMCLVLFVFVGLSWIIWTATGVPLTTL